MACPLPPSAPSRALPAVALARAHTLPLLSTTTRNPAPQAVRKPELRLHQPKKAASARPLNHVPAHDRPLGFDPTNALPLSLDPRLRLPSFGFHRRVRSLAFNPDLSSHHRTAMRRRRRCAYGFIHNSATHSHLLSDRHGQCREITFPHAYHVNVYRYLVLCICDIQCGRFFPNKRSYSQVRYSL